MKLDKNDRFKSGADSAKKSTPLDVAVVSKRMRFTTRDYDNDVWSKIVRTKILVKMVVFGTRIAIKPAWPTLMVICTRGNQTRPKR